MALSFLSTCLWSLLHSDCCWIEGYPPLHLYGSASWLQVCLCSKKMPKLLSILFPHRARIFVGKLVALWLIFKSIFIDLLMVLSIMLPAKPLFVTLGDSNSSTLFPYKLLLSYELNKFIFRVRPTQPQNMGGQGPCPNILLSFWEILQSLFSTSLHFWPSFPLSLLKMATIILNSLSPPPPSTHSPTGLTRYTTPFPLRYFNNSLHHCPSSTPISCNAQTVILPTHINIFFLILLY